MKGEPPLRVCHLGNDPHFSFFLNHTGRLQPAVCIHSCTCGAWDSLPPRALPALAPSSSLSSWHPFVSFFSFPTSHSGIRSSIHASACLPAALFIFIFPYSPPVSPVSCCFVVSLSPLSSLFLSAPPSSTCFVPGSLPASCARSSLFPRRFRKKCSAFLLSPAVISVLLLGCPPQAAGAAGRSPSSGGQTRGRQPAPCFCCSAPGEVLSESLASPLPRGGRRRSLAAARVRAGTWRVTAGLILLLRCSESWVCF